MNKKILLFSMLLLFFMVSLNVQAQETILIKNGTINPVVGSIIENGSLLIQKGKIVKVGKDISAPEGAKIIDAQGMYVYPGLVALMTALGVTGYPGAGNDTDETGVSTPQMDPYDALNPEDPTIEVARIEGVTTAMTSSGSRSVINGKAIALNLEGNLAEEMVVKRDVAVIFNTAAKVEGQYPSTIPGVASLIRDKLNDAKAYAEKKKKPPKKEEKKEGEKKTEAFKVDLGLEALIPVLEGKVPAVFVTNSEVTIRNALQIIKEYKLKGIIHARAGILKFADKLAAEKIPVIWAGTTTIPERWEPYDLNYNTAAVLSDKGVLFAFHESGRGLGNTGVRNLPVPASISVAHGLSEEEALKAITINPAKILGVDNQVGSLEAGKTANVVIASKNPIQMSSRVHTLVINGKIIPLTSLQTRLRDKFEKIVKARSKKKKNG
ncbi:amidohydrolase family protein [Acidobacteriota bacterium]